MKCYVCNGNELPQHALYRFPRNPSRKKLWMKYCNMEVWNSTYRLCSNHFVLKNFNMNGLLKKYAIPTVVMEDESQATNPSSLINLSMAPQTASSEANQDSLKSKGDSSDIDSETPLLEILQSNPSPPPPGLYEDTSSTIHPIKGDSDMDNETPLVEIVQPNFSPPPPGLFEDTSSTIHPIKGDSDMDNETPLVEIVQPNFSPPPPGLFEDTSSTIHPIKKNLEKVQQPNYSPLSPPIVCRQYVNLKKYPLPSTTKFDTLNKIQVPKISSEVIQGSLIPKGDLDTNRNIQHTVYNLPSPSKGGGYINVERFLLPSKKNECTTSSLETPQTASSKANQDSLKSKGDSSDIDSETPLLEILQSNSSPPPPGLYEDTSSTIHLPQKSFNATRDSLKPKHDFNTDEEIQQPNDYSPLSPPIACRQYVNVKRCSLLSTTKFRTSNRLQIPKTSSDGIQSSLIPKRDLDTNKNVENIVYNLPSPLIAGGQNTKLEKCSASPKMNDGTSRSVKTPQTASSKANQDSLKSKGDSSDIGSETPLLEILQSNFSPPLPGLYEDISSTIHLSQTNSPAETHSNSSKSSDDDSDINGSNTEAWNADGFNTDNSNAVNYNAVDFSVDYSTTDVTNPNDIAAHDSDKDEEIQYFPYKSLPSTPHVTLERSSPLPEEEYEDTLNNDHIPQATSSSITTPINDSNTHAGIPNLGYYPSENLALRSIKLERCSPPPEEEYEDTLNTYQIPQATSSSITTPINDVNTHAAIPNLGYYPSENLALRSIKLERCSPPPEEEYEDTLNSLHNWQQIKQEPQSCHLEYYGSLIQESPALVLSNVKTERITPTHEPSYSYIDDYGNYGNYGNYENMETINQPMYLPESHSELQYEGNIGESYLENQTVVAESEINKMATAEPEKAELRTAELEPPKDLSMQPEPSSDVDKNSKMKGKISNTLKRKLNFAEFTNKQLKHRVTQLVRSNKKLRQEKEDLILELKTFKTSEPN